MDMSFYCGKRVLVTGHTGFKGTWLCKMLTMAGAQVTGYSLEPPTDPSLFAIAELENEMDSIIGDSREFAHLEEVLNKHMEQTGDVDGFIENMYREVDDFADGEMQADDITMVFLSRR